MAIEIERKFLIDNDGWRNHPDLKEGEFIRQGYLNTTPERTVRVRQKGNQAFITIKGKAQGLSRLEFEYEIPLSDAEALFALCERPPLSKKRYVLPTGNLFWEIDEFFDENEGLLIAEIELPSEDESIELPAWLGKEVSTDKHYTNAYLSLNPYTQW